MHIGQAESAMNLEAQLEVAIALASEYHKKQLDKSGAAYILHPLAVMQAVAPDRKAMIVAVLHDVVEDTRLNAPDLTLAGIEDELVEAVMQLTREPKGYPTRRSYRQYVEDLLSNDLARKVKKADVEHNLRLERMGKLPEEERKSLKERYIWTLKRIEEYAREREEVRLADVIADFSVAMHGKLNRKAEQGYRGWDDPKMENAICESFDKHVEKITDLSVEEKEENFVDIANLAMFRWNFERMRRKKK